jgi:hypothetical protein
MADDLCKVTKLVRASNAVAAGSADSNGDIIDTHGARHALFNFHFGAIVAGAVTGVKIQHSDASNMSGAVDITGSAVSIADTDDDKLVQVEVKHITKRYLRAVVTRATQNATLNGATCLLHGLMRTEQALDAGVKSRTVVTG